MSGIELEDVYDEPTLARIERHAPRPAPETERSRAHSAAALAVAASFVIGVRDVLQPEERPVIEAVDPWTDGGTHPRVRFHWHPVPWLSVAEVLW